MFLRRAGRSGARKSHIPPSTLVSTTSPSPFHPHDVIVFLKHKPDRVLCQFGISKASLDHCKPTPLLSLLILTLCYVSS